MDLYKIVLEDEKEYYIIDTIIYGENKYVVLGNQNEDDFNIRKVVLHNDEECLIKLDSKEYNCRVNWYCFNMYYNNWLYIL